MKKANGRPPIGQRAMTSTERGAKFRANQRKRYAEFETRLAALEEQVARLSTPAANVEERLGTS
jgi:hypothetical protein